MDNRATAWQLVYRPKQTDSSTGPAAWSATGSPIDGKELVHRWRRSGEADDWWSVIVTDRMAVTLLRFEPLQLVAGGRSYDACHLICAPRTEEWIRDLAGRTASPPTELRGDQGDPVLPDPQLRSTLERDPDPRILTDVLAALLSADEGEARIGIAGVTDVEAVVVALTTILEVLVEGDWSVALGFPGSRGRPNTIVLSMSEPYSASTPRSASGAADWIVNDYAANGLDGLRTIVEMHGRAPLLELGDWCRQRFSAGRPNDWPIRLVRENLAQGRVTQDDASVLALLTTEEFDREIGHRDVDLSLLEAAAKQYEGLDHIIGHLAEGEGSRMAEQIFDGHRSFPAPAPLSPLSREGMVRGLRRRLSELDYRTRRYEDIERAGQWDERLGDELFERSVKAVCATHFVSHFGEMTNERRAVFWDAVRSKAPTDEDKRAIDRAERRCFPPAAARSNSVPDSCTYADVVLIAVGAAIGYEPWTPRPSDTTRSPSRGEHRAGSVPSLPRPFSEPQPDLPISGSAAVHTAHHASTPPSDQAASPSRGSALDSLGGRLRSAPWHLLASVSLGLVLGLFILLVVR